MILAVMVALGMLAGLGIWLLVREASPTTQPHLGSALDRLAPDQLRAPDHDPAPAHRGRGPQDALGGLLEDHLAGRPGFITPTVELDLLGRSTRSWWVEKASLALLGLLIPVALIALVQLLGLGLPFPVPAGAGVALAVTFWFLPDATIRSKAAKARAEFVQAVVAYLQLSAIQRTTSGAQETLYATAEVGQSWPFERIRHELTRARWARVQPWDALCQLGERTSIPEISEVGDIMRLAGSSNAAVSDDLAERAAALQTRIMSEEWADSNKATSSMALPIGGMVLVLVLAIMVPAGLTLLQ